MNAIHSNDVDVLVADLANDIVLQAPGKQLCRDNGRPDAAATPRPDGR